MADATTSTGPVPALIGGDWAPASSSTVDEIPDPGSGETIAQLPYSTAEEVDRAVAAAKAAFAGWSETPVPQRAQVMFRFKRLLEEREQEMAALVTQENGKTLAESLGEVRRGTEVVDFACGAPTILMGTNLDPDRHGDRLRDHALPRRRGRGNYALQLPQHGAALDDPGRARLREHLRAQAVAAHAALGGAHRRAAGRGGPAGRRLQHRPRRQRRGERAARPPRRLGDLVRRLGRGGALHLPRGGGAREARAGFGRRQEPHRRHGRRGPGAVDPRAHLLRLRLRRPALPGGQRGGGGGLRGRRDGAPDRRPGRSAAGRPRQRPKDRDGAGDPGTSAARSSWATSTKPAARAPSSSATAAAPVPPTASSWAPPSSTT